MVGYVIYTPCCYYAVVSSIIASTTMFVQPVMSRTSTWFSNAEISEMPWQ
eukprot:m.9616 g.9616  ORF g.9616 m.9616 type:complete len:50 (+) comp3498_c0_seq1:278-427(+)